LQKIPGLNCFFTIVPNFSDLFIKPMVDSLGPHPSSTSLLFHLPPELGINRNVPYPVEDLLRVYLPSWLVRFLNDLWRLKVSYKHTLHLLLTLFSLFLQDSKACLADSFPSFGRGRIKNFTSAKIYLGFEEYSLLLEYLVRENTLGNMQYLIKTLLSLKLYCLQQDNSKKYQLSL